MESAVEQKRQIACGGRPASASGCGVSKLHSFAGGEVDAASADVKDDR
jgi:hypothetical protein